MPVPVIARKQAFEGGEQVVLGPRAPLHEGQPGSGMRHEDIDESVAATGAEPGELHRQVDRPLAGGVDLDLGRVHDPPSLSPRRDIGVHGYGSPHHLGPPPAPNRR